MEGYYKHNLLCSSLWSEDSKIVSGSGATERPAKESPAGTARRINETTVTERPARESPAGRRLRALREALRAATLRAEPGAVDELLGSLATVEQRLDDAK